MKINYKLAILGLILLIVALTLYSIYSVQESKPECGKTDGICPNKCDYKRDVDCSTPSTTTSKKTTTTSTTTTSTTVTPEPCNEIGCWPDITCNIWHVQAFCIDRQTYSSNPGWFGELDNITYMCGKNFCRVACKDENCCWNIRGYCYSLNHTSPTGCTGQSREVSSDLANRYCGQKGGNYCTNTSYGFDPPNAYGPLKCIINQTVTTTTTTTTQTTTTSTSATTSTTATTPPPACHATQTADTDFNAGTKINVTVNRTGEAADVILDIDKENPYVFIGYDDDTYNGNVKFAKSTDGGKTFKTTMVDPRPANSIGYVDRYVSMFSLDINTIYLVYKVWGGFTGNPTELRLAKSTDGGKTWSLSSISNNYPGYAHSISVVDTNTIFVIDNLYPCDDCDYDYAKMKFHKTTDGGKTWSMHVMSANELGVDDAEAGHCFPESLAVVDKDTIYIGYMQHGYWDLAFTKSTDGGSTWTPKVIVPGPAVHHCVSIQALDKENIFMSYETYSATPASGVHLGVGFTKSTDGGNTWTTHAVDPNNYGGYMSSEIHVVNPNTIFINYYDASGQLKFAKSTNGGSTWTLTTIDSGINPFNHALDANRLFIVYHSSKNMKFARSTDGGNTWTINTIDTGGLGDVNAFDVYYPSGIFTSSKIDMGANVNFTYLDFTITKPQKTDIKFQLRSAATQEGLSTATWYGPTSTSDYYTNTGTNINPVHYGHRWIQYKAFFSTEDVSKTPILHDVTIGCLKSK